MMREAGSISVILPKSQRKAKPEVKVKISIQ